MELVRTPSPPPPPSPLDNSDIMPVDLSERRQTSECHSTGQVKSQQQSQTTPTMRHNQVGTVILAGVPIVSLGIDGMERLCLAQISSTLLSKFSYNEIHNRRVALGVTCVQCTPVQLEILRRAGAMPISSRRCGMITKREAERLVKSFLEETAPPKLPENFAFQVKHPCGWGCTGSFVPARYNSSRAKCIKCTHCNVFFSPNKFIFHFHRTPDSKYQHPDAANFNSWRRHITLDGDNVNEDLCHAWEDVKAMFNGGSRKRLMSNTHSHSNKPGRVDLHLNKRPRLSDDHCSPMGKIPPVNFTYPMFPQTNNLNSILPCSPPYRNFPFLPQHDSPANLVEGVNPHKVNLAEMWKSNMNKNHPSPYYNPFGFLWAKNWGIYPPTDTSMYRVKTDPTLMNQKTETGRAMKTSSSKLNNSDDRNPDCYTQSGRTQKQSHHSAFKPVGLYTRSGQLGSPLHVESDVTADAPGDVTPEDHMWGGSMQHQQLFSPGSSEHSQDSALDSDQDPEHVTDDDINVTDVMEDEAQPTEGDDDSGVNDSTLNDSTLNDCTQNEAKQTASQAELTRPEITLGTSPPPNLVRKCKMLM